MKNDTRTVLETILPLTTDEIHYHRMKCENKFGVYKIPREDSIMIFTYLTFRLTQLVSSVILPLERIALLCITDRPMYPAYSLDHPMMIVTYEAGFGMNMHRQFNVIKNSLNLSIIEDMTWQSDKHVDLTLKCSEKNS